MQFRGKWQDIELTRTLMRSAVWRTVTRFIRALMRCAVQRIVTKFKKGIDEKCSLEDSDKI